jgi:hypothetical protein
MHEMSSDENVSSNAEVSVINLKVHELDDKKRGQAFRGIFSL